jgi:predicted TIM-barrel fold metal-dependent hydrolase
MIPPLISLEEHFFSAAMLASPTAAKYSEQFKHIPGLRDKLSDVGPLRLSGMDANNISLQIVSHAPGSMSAGECRSANDQLSHSVKQNPDRFAGFAVLPVSEPGACADELTRCVKDLGFVGALIDNHSSSGQYFDGPEYLPLFQVAQDLDVPIYLHPTWPTANMLSTLYTGNFPLSATQSISASAFGWHSDVATHILRLFASGLFDTLPRLKLIIGHMGEMLPFMLARITQLSVRWGPRARDFQAVYDENLWITTSGNWSVDPMACILRNTRIDHVLFSVDYPFGKNEDGVRFMRELEESGLVDREGLEKIAYRNAEALLRVKHTKEDF